MKKHKYLLRIGIVLSLLFCFWFFYLRTERENRLKKEANVLIKQIEFFRMKNKRLPNTIEDIGLKEIDGIDALYYTKRDSLHYMISFGMDLGESKFYYSDTKKWEDRYQEMR
jgi:hypothetical protein